MPQSGWSVPYIDYSWIGDIGSSLGGVVSNRMDANRMKDAVAQATGPDGTVDYSKLTSALLAAGDPESAAKAAAIRDKLEGSANRFGLNPVPVLGDDGTVSYYQPSSQGGPPQRMDFGGGRPMLPQTIKEGPGGWTAFPSKAPYGGAAPSAPSTGGETPQSPGVLAPSLGSAKYGQELRKTMVNDQQTIADIDQGIAQMENNIAQFAPGGVPTEGLKNIAGSYQFGPVAIPKDWVPTTQPESAKAEKSLKSFGVEVGLQTLQKMRAQSAQGASGMGQLAIQESEWLQNSIRALQTAQSPDDVAKASQDVLFFTRLVSQRLKEGYRQIYGQEPGLSNVEGAVPPSQAGTSGMTGPQGAPMDRPLAPGMVVGGFRYKGGSPNDQNSWEPAQ